MAYYVSWWFRLSIRRIFFAIVIVVLVLSVTLSWHHLNLRAQNQNTLNNMRARTLASYGSEIVTMAFFLEEYLKTLDPDIIQQEVRWGIPTPY
jgi:ABC-type glycerol-3-phosphate transport system permease component